VYAGVDRPQSFVRILVGGVVLIGQYTVEAHVFFFEHLVEWQRALIWHDVLQRGPWRFGPESKGWINENS
jgi:hypothetical protein